MYTLHFSNLDILIVVMLLIIGSIMFSKKGKWKIKLFFKDISKSKYPFISLFIYGVVIFMSTILCLYLIKTSSLMSNPVIEIAAVAVAVFLSCCSFIIIFAPLFILFEENRYRRELNLDKKCFYRALDSIQEKCQLQKDVSEEDIIEELYCKFHNTALSEEFSKSVIRNIIQKMRQNVN